MLAQFARTAFRRLRSGAKWPVTRLPVIRVPHVAGIGRFRFRLEEITFTFAFRVVSGVAGPLHAAVGRTGTAGATPPAGAVIKRDTVVAGNRAISDILRAPAQRTRSGRTGR